jgi:hypothetical protein
VQQQHQCPDQVTRLPKVFQVRLSLAQRKAGPRTAPAPLQESTAMPKPPVHLALLKLCLHPLAAMVKKYLLFR